MFKNFIFLTKSFILLEFILKPFNLSLIISLAPFLLKVITGTPDDKDSINVIPNDLFLQDLYKDQLLNKILSKLNVENIFRLYFQYFQ